ncbi:IS630 transposase-related protein [Pleurocapsa sp. FMAR1]|uniref:IS630 transposase-related protein n=1 Tax=Pleurocapsa sp. FMAR1 TaxID=3040204 RepID=UPI0029C6144E|nr:IS630 transposase-related protein [Pleurocapsa sp. FMAR1]
MPAPYSYDLREKAINAVKRGEKKIVVCRLMKISRNTLDLWLRRERETGDFQAIIQLLSRDNRKIQDLNRFRQFVKQHQDKTQQKIAELWGEKLTQQNVSDGIKKLSITRKKWSYPLRVRAFAQVGEAFRHFDGRYKRRSKATTTRPPQRVTDPQRKCLTNATASPRRRYCARER